MARPNVGEDADKWSLIHCWWGCKVMRAPRKIVWRFHNILHIWSSSCTPGHLPQRNENSCPHKSLCTSLHSSFIYNIPNLETKCPSMGKCLNNLWCIHIMEYFYSVTGKKWIVNICNLDEYQGNYAEWKKVTCCMI